MNNACNKEDIDSVIRLLRYMPKSHESAAADIIESLAAQRDELLSTLKLAETWLEGWSSATHELSIIRAQIAKCEAQS